MLPILNDSNVQSGFCTKLLQEFLSRQDTKESYLQFLLFEMPISSSTPPFDASCIELSAVLKKRFTDNKLLRGLFELGMTAEMTDIQIAVDVLPDTEVGVKNLELILSRCSLVASLKSMRHAAKKAGKTRLASCLAKHEPKPAVLRAEVCQYACNLYTRNMYVLEF